MSRIIAGFAALFLLAAIATPAAAQTVRTPAAGTPERAAVLDALRPEVEGLLGAPVEFAVDAVRIADDWAFVQVTPQRPGGAPIQQPDPGMDGLRTEAFLRLRDGTWVVTHWEVGATDVWYAGWCDEAPAGLIGDMCP